MQILIISPNKSEHKHWTLTKNHLLAVSILLSILFVYAVYYTSQHLITNSISVTERHAVSTVDAIVQPLIVKHAEIEKIKAEIPDIYAKQLGVLQAESIRLKAITKQLATMTGLDLSEYAFESEPAQGGIQEDGEQLKESEFSLDLNQLSDSFNKQLHQLEIMQTYVITEDAIASTIPSRRPINKGWLSSHYGKRVDPFTGKMAFHHGIDFAGKEGDSIYAVADGMVSWVGEKHGYGKMVEIDHGNGYVTRYAHSEKLLVSLGEMVSKDQEIALMGSTGRSTGPHVHFELLVAGHKVNPQRFTKN